MEYDLTTVIIDLVAPLFTMGVMWQIWNIKKSFDDTANVARGAKQTSWDNQKKIDELATKVDVLLEDHKDIKRMQEDGMEFSRKLYDQHNKQDVEIAKIQKDLDEIKRSKK